MWWLGIFLVILVVCAIVLSIVAMATRGGRKGPRGRRGRTGPVAGGGGGPTLSYYLFISDFIQSFIQIPTSNVLVDSTTIASSYLAGRAPLYNSESNLKVGICSASFLNMQTPDGIFTDISNYISAEGGLIVSWLTPTTLINLELDSIVHSMVTEARTTVTTKVGLSLYYGKTFDLVVSSDQSKIHFAFTPVH